MAQRIVMPSFGMYTAEGSLGRWLIASGSAVQTGDLIVEVVTEKATYKVESPASGILYPVAVEGENLIVEGLIGWILADGEVTPPDDSDSDAGAGLAPARAGTSPAATSKSEPERVKASPIARRLAAEKGIDLRSLTGTGPGGRIAEADVLATTAAWRETPWRVRERLPLTGARKTIAARLRRSVDTAVSLTLTREVRADALVAARQDLAARLSAEIPLGRAVRQVPRRVPSRTAGAERGD